VAALTSVLVLFAALVGKLQGAAPTSVSDAYAVLEVLSSILLMVFLLFLVLKDGPSLWSGLTRMVPERHRAVVHG
jgi:predicted PurR-regulated permease PerM